MPYSSISAPSRGLLTITAQQLFKLLQQGAILQSVHNPFEQSYIHELITRIPDGRVYQRISVDLINELLSQHKIRRTEYRPWNGAVNYFYNLMIVCNAVELLELMQTGAILTSRWRYGKRINNLKLPTGESLTVQYSNVQSLLKHGKIYSIPLSGDNYDYYLVKPPCPTT
jgi:hypothetical protein